MTKTYVAGHGGCRAAVRALDAIDLDVAPGELVELVGPRGAGKSTLLLCAAGLVVPDGGAVAWPAAPAPPALRDPLASGYAAFRAPGAPLSFGAVDPRLRLVLVDGSDLGAGAGRDRRSALGRRLAELCAGGVAAVVTSRTPCLERATRLVLVAAGRIARDAPCRRSATARVAERALAVAETSIDPDSGPV